MNEIAEKQRQKLIDDALEAEAMFRLEIQEAQKNEAKARQDEREKIEREQQAAKNKAEVERKLEEDRQSNQRHRNKVEEEACQSIREAFPGKDYDLAEQIIETIKDDLIKHVSINY